MSGRLDSARSLDAPEETGPSPLSETGGHYRPAVPFDEMVRLCGRRLAKDPHNTAALLRRARAEMHLGDFHAAVADLRTLVSLADCQEGSSGPDAVESGRLVEGLFYMGCCHAQLGDDDSAIADFSRTLELEPGHKRAAYGRAACRNRQGDFAGAIEDYERAFSSDKATGDRSGRVGSDGRGKGKASSFDPSSSALAPRKLRSQFASARQRGEGLPGYVAELQERQRQRQAQRLAHPRPPSSLPTSSANVSPSTSAGSSVTDIAHRNGTSAAGPALGQNHANSAAAAAAATSALHGEWGTDGGVGGMSAMDPASLTTHSSSFYSLSDFSGDEGDIGPGGGGEGTHSANYYVQRGLFYRKQGDLQQAVEMYTKALEIDPKHFKGLFNRAFCYDKLGRLQLAVRDYEQAAQVEPANPYTYYNLGISCDRLNDLARAVGAFTKAIDRDHGRNPDFFHNRGFSLRKMGDYHAAIADYDRAIELNPTHFKSRFNRGFCYDRVGQYERAVADYTVALRTDPKSVNVLHNRGVALEKLGRLPEALADFNCALVIDPNSGYTYNARGLVHDQMRHWEAAISDFTKAVQLQPLNASFLYNRGYAYRSMGKLENAVADYSACVAIDSGNVTALNSRAFVLRKMGRYDDAVQDYSTVIEQQRNSTASASESRSHRGVAALVRALNNRAYCLARVGRYPEAIEDYTAVLAVDPVNTHALHNRAISFEKTGNYHASIEDLTQLIAAATAGLGREGAEDGPEDEEEGGRKGSRQALSSAYHSRGAAWLRLNKTAEAARDFRKALDVDLAPLIAREGGGGAAVEMAKRAHPAWHALQHLP